MNNVLLIQDKSRIVMLKEIKEVVEIGDQPLLMTELTKVKQQKK